MSWVPLPFPKCPECGNTWSLTYHRNCPFNSDVEVETILKRTRCKPCKEEWLTIESQFYCTCGHIFTGREVKSAILKTLELKEKLERFLREMNYEEQRIEEVSKESFKAWLNNTSYQLGKTIGIIAGTVIRIIASVFS